MVVDSQVRSAAAAILKDRRAALAASLAQLVAGWPKYSASYAADPAGFAEIELAALVDYLICYINGDDENFRHLYIGEKVKQFYDPDTPEDVRRARQTVVLASERRLFCDALGADDSPAIGLVIAFFDAVDHALMAEVPAQANVLFVGDCLYLDVSSFLVAPALADGVRINPSYVASHEPGEIRAALAKFADSRFDAVFFSPFTYAFLADYEALQRPRAALDPRRAPGLVRSAVKAAESVFDTIADLFDCPIVVHLPTAILRHDDHLRERLSALATAPARKAAIAALRSSLNRRIEARRASGQIILPLDEDDLVRPVGRRAAGRHFYHSALQHPARFGTLVAEAYRDIIFVVARLLKRKLVACDLDNTLWEGVIGEGLGVRHHFDRQAPLLALKERGVVLTINSKNDPAKVIWEAGAGRLSLEHFVSRQINWDPKPLNIQRIAEHLNLKDKDFVFIDDRADERAMVEQRYPKLLALDALDPRSWRLLALWADLLPATPGADRTEFYRQRDSRQAFIAQEAESSAQQRAELFAQLGLTLDIREAGEADIPRATDLINRTNQFNMAGSRITKKRVEELVARDDGHVLICDAADRFGPMGTIAVLIVEREAGVVRIPAFVLSCRVFGYGMEFAILEAARQLASPHDRLFGEFRVTDHNQPCHEVYPAAGFVRRDDGWMLESAAAAAISVPDWLNVTNSVSTRSIAC